MAPYFDFGDFHPSQAYARNAGAPPATHQGLLGNYPPNSAYHPKNPLHSQPSFPELRSHLDNVDSDSDCSSDAGSSVWDESRRSSRDSLDGVGSWDRSRGSSRKSSRRSSQVNDDVKMKNSVEDLHEQAWAARRAVDTRQFQNDRMKAMRESKKNQQSWRKKTSQGLSYPGRHDDAVPGSPMEDVRYHVQYPLNSLSFTRLAHWTDPNYPKLAGWKSHQDEDKKRGHSSAAMRREGRIKDGGRGEDKRSKRDKGR
ncbi:hypothetical protein T439DRAFT_356252 [Meredithblackwellia eburnea MCA 4105]